METKTIILKVDYELAEIEASVEKIQLMLEELTDNFFSLQNEKYISNEFNKNKIKADIALQNIFELNKNICNLRVLIN